jgi:hypothetical protein
MVSLLLDLLDPQPPGRLWWFEQSLSRKAQDVLSLALGALMLFGPPACH